MKKVLTILIMMLIILSGVPAMITFSGEMSYDDKAWLIEIFHATYFSRADADIVIKSLVEGEDTVDLSFSIDGEERFITAPDREALGMLLERAMKAEKALFLDESCIFHADGSIIASHTGFRPGRLVEAYDKDGDTRAVLMTREKNGDVNLFSSWMEKDLLPGLSLRKGPVCSLELALSTPFRMGEMSAQLNVRNLVGFENVFFRGGFRWTMSGGTNAFHAALGIESRASLSSLFDTHFTLVEDAAVFAAADLLLGWSRGFSVAGAYTIGYEHMIGPVFFWRLGLGTDSLTDYRPAMTISGGVLL